MISVNDVRRKSVDTTTQTRMHSARTRCIHIRLFKPYRILIHSTYETPLRLCKIYHLYLRREWWYKPYSCTTYRISPSVPLKQHDFLVPDEAPVLDHLQADFDVVFKRFWTAGVPIVVTNALCHVTIPDLDRSYFMRHHGEDKVDLVDCRPDGQERSKVPLRIFLSAFGTTRPENSPIWKIRVRFVLEYLVAVNTQTLKHAPGQDWPPKQRLSSTLPELHNQMERTVPAPDITREDGVFNYVSQFPSNANQPDLGKCIILATKHC